MGTTFNGYPDPNGWMEAASGVQFLATQTSPSPTARIIAPDGRWLVPGFEQYATESTPWLVASRFPDEDEQAVYVPLAPQWAPIADMVTEVAPGSVAPGQVSLAQIEANNLRLARAPRAPGAC